jgi:gliding motility-associated-like protein
MIKNSIHTIILSLSLCLFSLAGYAQKSNVSPNAANSINLCQLYVATAFTPNGDGINDRFLVKYNGDCEMLEFNMKVFDRWGRLVFETKNPDEQSSWDGQSKGRQMKEGVYMWQVHAKLIDPNKTSAQSEVLDKKGTVALIR